MACLLFGQDGKNLCLLLRRSWEYFQELMERPVSDVISAYLGNATADIDASVSSGEENGLWFDVDNRALDIRCRDWVSGRKAGHRRC